MVCAAFAQSGGWPACFWPVGGGVPARVGSGCRHRHRLSLQSRLKCGIIEFLFLAASRHPEIGGVLAETPSPAAATASNLEIAGSASNAGPKALLSPSRVRLDRGSGET